MMRWCFVGLLAIVAVTSCGCTPRSSSSADDVVKVELTVRPEPPKVGDAKVLVSLTTRDGEPVRGAAVKLEGNMNHAGMKPVFADAKEVEPGKYEATLEFTMGGDWFILIDAVLADGKEIDRKVDVPGVRSS